MAAIDQGYPV
jgi:hypothetical protein